MYIVKKLSLSSSEIETMIRETNKYAWIAVDAKKGMIVAGDEFVGDLKNELLKWKCLSKDIFGAGIDLCTGDVDYRSTINPQKPDIGSMGEIPEEFRERIDTLIRYFFLELPCYKKEKLRPRFTKKI